MSDAESLLNILEMTYTYIPVESPHPGGTPSRHGLFHDDGRGEYAKVNGDNIPASNFIVGESLRRGPDARRVTAILETLLIRRGRKWKLGVDSAIDDQLEGCVVNRDK
jgi:hypothetical protein